MNHILKLSVIGFVFFMPYLSEAGYYYRWTDSKGVVHYSSSIPPKNSQNGHVELSKNGIKRKVVLSAKRKKELKEKAEKLKIQKIKDEKLKKEKARQEEEEIRLLSIFSAESEVTKTYNSKLRMAQLTIDLLKSRHEKQSKKLETLERKKDQSKNIKHTRLIEKQIEVALDNLSIYQQAITQNIIEKDRIRKEFKETLSRFKELTAKQNIKDK